MGQQLASLIMTLDIGLIFFVMPEHAALVGITKEGDPKSRVIIKIASSYTMFAKIMALQVIFLSQPSNTNFVMKRHDAL
jgi:hypothetical protein